MNLHIRELKEKLDGIANISPAQIGRISDPEKSPTEKPTD